MCKFGKSCKWNLIAGDIWPRIPQHIVVCFTSFNSVPNQHDELWTRNICTKWCSLLFSADGCIGLSKSLIRNEAVSYLRICERPSGGAVKCSAAVAIKQLISRFLWCVALICWTCFSLHLVVFCHWLICLSSTVMLFLSSSDLHFSNSW